MAAASCSWMAKSPTTKNTVWLKTITANVTDEASASAPVLFQKLFDDMSLQTHKAFQDAPELHGSRP